MLGALVQWCAAMLVRHSLKLFMDIWPNHGPILIFSFYTWIPNCLCKMSMHLLANHPTIKWDHGLNKAVGIRILVSLIPLVGLTTPGTILLHALHVDRSTIFPESRPQFWSYFLWVISTLLGGLSYLTQ